MNSSKQDELVKARRKAIGQCLRRLYDLHEWKYPEIEDADRKIKAAMIVLASVQTEAILPLFAQALSKPGAKSKFGTLMETVRDEYARQRAGEWLPVEWRPFETDRPKALAENPEVAARAKEEKRQLNLRHLRGVLHGLGGWPKCKCDELCDSNDAETEWFCWKGECDFHTARTVHRGRARVPATAIADAPAMEPASSIAAPVVDVRGPEALKPIPPPRHRDGSTAMAELREQARQHPELLPPELLEVLLDPEPSRLKASSNLPDSYESEMMQDATRTVEPMVFRFADED